MSTEQPKMLQLDDAYGRRCIAWMRTPGSTARTGAPGALWLPGFNSVMTSSKATALAAWSEQAGRALTRFDYSGHGASDGRFEDGTIGQWLADSLAVFQRLTAGRQVLVGSSMGGYLALLLARALPRPEAARLAGLVLIAPAWNMTERLIWAGMPAEVRDVLMREGVWQRPSQYGEPYPMTRRLIEEGRGHLIDIHDLALPCPLTVLHGALDPDVPFAGSAELVAAQRGGSARLVTVPDGDHRLAREQDVALLIGEIERPG